MNYLTIKTPTSKNQVMEIPGSFALSVSLGKQFSAFEQVAEEITEQIAGKANWQDLLETALDGLRADVTEKLGK